MEGYPIQQDFSMSMRNADPLYTEALQKASNGDFDGAEGLLWNIASIFHGGSGCPAPEDDPLYVRQSAERVIYTGPGYGVPCTNPMVLGKSLMPPRDPSVHWYVSSAALGVDAAKAKWEEGAPARAAEWEKGAPLRKAAEEVARLKAEIARVEQEEVERQAALVKEAQEKLRIQKEEEEEKARKAEVTSLERDAAALREKLAAIKGLNAEKRERDEKEKKERDDRLAEMERETAIVRENLAVMKELMAMKAADPISYAAFCTATSRLP